MSCSSLNEIWHLWEALQGKTAKTNATWYEEVVLQSSGLVVQVNFLNNINVDLKYPSSYKKMTDF